jgi:hypothetical protein
MNIPLYLTDDAAHCESSGPPCFSCPAYDTCPSHYEGDDEGDDTD